MDTFKMVEQGKTVEAMACHKCGCTWLYKTVVGRWSASQMPLGFGPEKFYGFPVMKCAACGELIFPSIEPMRAVGPDYELYKEMIEDTSGNKTTERITRKTRRVDDKRAPKHLPRLPQPPPGPLPTEQE